jgi:hypothetical protein
MIHNITESIQGLAVDIDLLHPLENNARRGDVDAIMASYTKFGQVKPIVAVADEKNSLTVIAGNHQLEAAKRLGWQQIAVSVVDMSTSDALAYALADNRLSELGLTDNDLLYEMLTEVIGHDEDFFDALGWDDFSVAAIENTMINNSFGGSNDPNSGWTAPEIVMHGIDAQSPGQLPNSESVAPHEAPTNSMPVTLENIVTQGSTVTDRSGTSNASIQFTLVFENAGQQSKWYSFLKWLKDQPAYDGDTTSERLLDFISQHSPRG